MSLSVKTQGGTGGMTASTEYPGCYYREVNGVVEWVNPPMHTGAVDTNGNVFNEYRTVERYRGKPVYVILVDCGIGPIGSNRKDTPFAANAADISAIVSMQGYFDSGNFCMTPTFYDEGYATYMFISGRNVVVYSTEKNNTAHFYAIVKYTKSADEEVV